MHQKSCGLRRQKKIMIHLMIAAAVWLTAYAPSRAAEEKTTESGWEFVVAPYLWAISMDGDVTLRGFEADVDVGFSDIWDDLNIAFMIAYEARKGRFGLWGNTIYAELEDSDLEGPAGFTKADLTVDTFWQELGGFYRLGTWDLTDDPAKRSATVTVDAFFGARYTYLDAEIDFKFDGVFRSFRDDVNEDQSWLEPLIGVRTIWDFSERWRLTMGGDIGGAAFGSDFAWSASGLLGYQFSFFKEDNARVFMGYRALSQDYSDGSGDDKFEWDVTLHGPILGLGIQF
jgi:hypothetical protein